MRTQTRVLFGLATLVMAACKTNEGASGGPAGEGPGPLATTTASTAATAPALDRASFNKLAVRLNIPLYWSADKNNNGTPDPDEIAALLFYPSEGHWVENGAFTPAFNDALKRIQSFDTDLAKTPPGPDAARQKLVMADLDDAAGALVATDLRKAPQVDRDFARHMLKVASLIDDLFATQTGAKALIGKVNAHDTLGQSLFRRDWGPKCATPKYEGNAACSAIQGSPKQPVDVYPAATQDGAKFCETLEKAANAKQLLTPFVVVRDQGGKLTPVSYADAYKEPMAAVSNELKAAAGVLGDSEGPLKAYLLAAAQSFTDNNWNPADEAWAQMNATNSAWYVRVGPDEVYWEPCSQKAGFHLTFARINRDSLAWQEKLKPVQQDMETSLAGVIGTPYKARKVTFHLPDFIDIVLNAGDDRDPVGATIGQSLPNWGPLTASGRGRTVAMSNLYTDPDSGKVRRQKAESVLVPAAMTSYAKDAQPALLSTILHEATHNLGPSHEYRAGGKTDAQAFGGDLASMLEELKAQTGGLYFIDFAKQHNLISPDLAKQTYVDSVVWALNHIARGMYSESGQRKPYSQLAAIQIGFLLDEHALTFDPQAGAADGTSKGAFAIDFDKFPAAAEKLMKAVGQVKATGDKGAAEALAKKYVDGDVVPQKLIAERFLRFPQPNFVYALEL